MRSWIRPRNSPSDPSTRSAGREMVCGGELRFLVLAIDRRILVPDNYLCQLAFSLIHPRKSHEAKAGPARRSFAAPRSRRLESGSRDRAGDEASPLSCWAHGIVHLMEGDLSNARYWYREAGRAFPRRVSIQD